MQLLVLSREVVILHPEWRQISSKPLAPVFTSHLCALPCPVQPVLPSSGTAEWLLELLEPETPTNSASTNPGSTHDSSNLSASNSTAALDATAPGLRGLVPRAGVLIDTLKHLNPGVKLFRYPDAKKPGCFKERPPYTNWSQVMASAAMQSTSDWPAATRQESCPGHGPSRDTLMIVHPTFAVQCMCYAHAAISSTSARVFKDLPNARSPNGSCIQLRVCLFDGLHCSCCPETGRGC